MMNEAQAAAAMRAAVAEVRANPSSLRIVFHPHAFDRIEQRRITQEDVIHVMGNASTHNVEAGDLPERWLVYGRTRADGEEFYAVLVMEDDVLVLTVVDYQNKRTRRHKPRGGAR